MRVLQQIVLAIVDYNQMSARDINEKIRVELIELPEYIRNVTYHPREVKYLIGEKMIALD